MSRPPGAVCVLCGRRYTEYGHNAEPLSPGRCCDRCNSKKVIPARIKEIREMLARDTVADLEAAGLKNKSGEGD